MPTSIVCTSHQPNGSIAYSQTIRFQIGEETPAFDVLTVQGVCRRIEDLPQDPMFVTGDATTFYRNAENPRLFECNWMIIPMPPPGQTWDVGLRGWVTIRRVDGNVTVPLTVTNQQPPMGP